MPPDPATIQIVPTSTRYAEQLEHLYRFVYNDWEENSVDLLSAAMFRNHLVVFPEGQFIALDPTLPEGEQVIGLTVSLRMPFDLAHPFVRPWRETTGDGWLTTHDPDGDWLYGVESSVHPDYQSMGIGGRLIEARFDVVRRLNLCGMVAGSALMSYHAVADRVPIHAYVAGVIDGTYFDMNLSKQLRKGFVYAGILIPDYVVDVEARGWGAIIVRENANYTAPHA
ncbi:MAG: GNAT family N-acetyltransferase [Chloroflexota bacterium]|nr:GNAT family N-acetyltransferase [Chloroflexota bacterium]